MATVRKAGIGLGFFVGLLLAGPAQASYQVTVDTTNLFGTSGALVFELIDGDLVVPSSTVTISSFVTDGGLGSATFNGASTSNLSGPVAFSDSALSGLNDYLQLITLGNSLSFVLDVVGPGGSFHDSLSFFITYPDGTGTLVDTTNGGALLTWDAGVTDPMQPVLFQGTTFDDVPLPVSIDATPVAAAVPEPGTLMLLCAALLAAALGRLAGRARIRVQPTA